MPGIPGPPAAFQKIFKKNCDPFAREMKARETRKGLSPDNFTIAFSS